MLTFSTSYSYDKVVFKIIPYGIILDKVPFVLQDIPMFVVLSDPFDKEISQSYIKWSNENKVMFGEVSDGLYFLNLYTKYNMEDENYWPYFQSRSLSILITNKKMHFVVAPIINSNRYILANLKTDSNSLKKYLQPSYLCESNSTLIQTLAKKITIFKIAPMQKLLAIHDWVADNIYYDYDALDNLKCNQKDYSALNVLFTKKCVCRGYANLGVALMRASGIPAIGLSCYSLNISSDGGWERPENNVNYPNHIIAVAFVDKRWVYMDITWDSDNKYENGKFLKKTGAGISRRYFDTTLEMISNTHKFIYQKEI